MMKLHTTARRCRAALCRLFLATLLPTVVPTVVPALAETPANAVWTLTSTVQRARAIAPDIRAAQAEIEVRQGALRQAGLWSNPGIEVRADDKVAKERGDNSTEFSQFAIRQALPLNGHIGHRKAAARAEVNAARSDFGHQQLLLETEVAQRYYQLQLTAAHLRVARQRLTFADEFQRIGQRRQQAGEMARLERLRLDLLRESAQQIAERAEGEYSEALSQLRIYLDLPIEAPPSLAPLGPITTIPGLAVLRDELPSHPALRAAEYRLAAARETVNLARAERIPDPELRFFRDRDVLAGREQNVTGFGVAVSLPLWDRNQGRLGEVGARVSQAQAHLDALRRELTGRLLQSHTHLHHLVTQEQHYRTAVLEPARALFELTSKAYRNGEAEILALIDANNGWFDAQDRHAELLQQAGQEAAQLRLAAGRPLVTTTTETVQ